MYRVGCQRGVYGILKEGAGNGARGFSCRSQSSSEMIQGGLPS